MSGLAQAASLTAAKVGIKSGAVGRFFPLTFLGQRRAMERLGYKPREFAQAIGLSVWLLYRLWRDGEGPPYKVVGNHRIIEVEAGRRWLQEQDEKSSLT